MDTDYKMPKKKPKTQEVFLIKKERKKTMYLYSSVIHGNKTVSISYNVFGYFGFVSDLRDFMVRLGKYKIILLHSLIYDTLIEHYCMTLETC